MRTKSGRRETIAILALAMALAALGIDLMLPAFPEMRLAFDLAADSTEIARTVTTFFLGLAIGPLIFGPLADRFGRRSVLFAGLAIYIAGAVASAVAPTLPTLFAARFLWGVGAAGPRTVVIAMVRDRYQGDQMTKLMSLIMAVFLLVPIVAPTIGTVIVAVAPWQFTFWFCAGIAVLVSFWGLRLDETLVDENRLPLSFSGIVSAGREVVSNRTTIGYTMALTAMFVPFISYLGTSEVIIDDVYDQAEFFPLIFGGLAAMMGLSMLTNSRMVEKLGTRRTVQRAALGYLAATAFMVVVSLATDGRPALVVWLVGLACVMVAHAFMSPSFNSIAMEQMGHVAGTASAIIGTVSTATAAVLAAILDRQYDGTVTPLMMGYLVSAVVVLLLVVWAERGRLQLNGSKSSDQSVDSFGTLQSR